MLTLSVVIVEYQCRAGHGTRHPIQKDVAKRSEGCLKPTEHPRSCAIIRTIVRPKPVPPTPSSCRSGVTGVARSNGSKKRSQSRRSMPYPVSWTITSRDFPCSADDTSMRRHWASSIALAALRNMFWNIACHSGSAPSGNCSRASTPVVLIVAPRMRGATSFATSLTTCRALNRRAVRRSSSFISGPKSFLAARALPIHSSSSSAICESDSLVVSGSRS